MRAFDFISIAVVLIITIASGLYPFSRKAREMGEQTFPISESIAAGVFLGASLIHMLGDASAGFYQASFHYPLAFFLAGLMFLFLLLLEHIGREIISHNGSQNAFVILATLMLSVHAFLMGAALGLSVSFSVALVILLAVVAHKWAESFSLAIQINKSRFSNSTNIMLFSVFALMTPAGILLGLSAHASLLLHPLLAPVFNSLAAGTFLYLGTLHGLEKATLIKQCCDLKRFFFVIFGFLIMAAVALFV